MPAVPATAPKTSENTLSSLALVDTLSLLDGRLRLTLGICHQFVKISNFNTSTGAVTESYDKSAVTPAVALVIKPWGQGISLYADYVQGLSKGATITYTTDAHSHAFAPYKTEQKEAGIKWNVVTFSNTVSLFEITKPMLISVYGNDALDDGEKRVRGLEWNVFGEVKRGIRLFRRRGLHPGRANQDRERHLRRQRRRGRAALARKSGRRVGQSLAACRDAEQPHHHQFQPVPEWGQSAGSALLLGHLQRHHADRHAGPGAHHLRHGRLLMV